MQRQCAAKEEPSPHSSVLHLLTSPLRLLCASIWHIVQERDVLNYGMLEEFVTLITETVPELLNHRQSAQLILGLRAKLVLELCRGEGFSNAKAIQHHLDRIRIPAAVQAESLSLDEDVETSKSNFLALVDILLNDPVERDAFFQEVFPVEYGPKYDLALERLIWTFVCRLEEALPVPSICEVASLLSISPSAIKECHQALSQPQDLLNSLNHHKNHARTETKGTPSPVTASLDEDCIFSCLSRPPLVRTMVDTECHSCEVELESDICEQAPIECEEVIDLDVEVDADDADVQLEAGLSKEADMDSSMEMVTAEDEQEEQPSSAEAATSSLSCFINEDGTVEYEDGEAVKGSQEGSGLGGVGEAESPSSEAQTKKIPSEFEHCYSQMEPVPGPSGDALSGLCLQRQPTVKLERIDISGKPLPAPPPRQSGRARKKKLLMLWKKNRGPEIAWLVEPAETIQSDVNLTTAKSGSNEKPAALVFACSKCSFHDATESSLHQHLMKSHPDEFSRLLSAGIHRTVGSKPGRNDTTAASVLQKSRRRGPVPKTCPLCAKTFTRGTDMRRHLKSHSGERLHCCLACGRCFLHVHHLKRHTATCKEGVAVLPNQDSQRKEGDQVNSTSPNEEIAAKVLLNSKDDPQDVKGEPQEAEMPTASAVLADGETPDPRLCPICGMILARASDMERHMRSHSVEKPYECMHCSKMYRYPYNLKKHIDLCHSELDVPGREGKLQPSNNGSGPTVLPADMLSKVCPTCGKAFTRAADMRRHQKCHSANRFECSKCGEGFHYPLDLKRHEQNCNEPSDHSQEIVPAKSQLICTTCGKTFSFLTHLNRHMRAHRQTGKPTRRWHKCPKCEGIFRTLYDLGKHQRCHWSDDPLRCTQCGRRFSNSGQLASHKQIHSLVCTMKCTMCEETFTELASFRWHYLEVHNVRGAYPCSHCEKSFTELCPLVRHVRTHTGERPFACQQCPKSFLTPTKLWLHRRVHGEQAGQERKRERRHLCHECGKCFYTPVELTRHEVVHREERPHMCAHCGKAFKRLRSLTAHMESHLEKEARTGFPCNYCGKTFMKAGALVRHNRIHTGERPHRCGECNKSFLTHSEVLKHMRFHTGSNEKPAALVFACSKCSFHDATESSLHQHLMKSHPDEFRRDSSADIPQTGRLKPARNDTTAASVRQKPRCRRGPAPKTCTLCAKTFTRSTSMRYHLKGHTGERLHCCLGCGRCFVLVRLLRRHTAACKEEPPILPNQDTQRGEGDKANSTSLNGEIGAKVLVKSKDVPHDSKDVSSPNVQTPDPRLCPMCGMVLARGTDIEGHMNSHSVEKPYECTHCFKMYRNSNNLKKHVDLCQTEFDVSGSENEDVQPSKDGSGTAYHFECSKCFEGFRYLLDRKDHEQRCTKSDVLDDELELDVSGTKRPLICSTCDRRFSFPSQLKSHKRTHQQIDNPPKQCHKCKEIFDSWKKLQRHQRCHWGDDPLRCTQCGRRFSSTVRLASHKQLHSLVFALKCTMCDETFTNQGKFRTHYLETHNIARAYPCSHCMKSCISVSKLVRHMRKHTGEQPFACKDCTRSFKSTKSLWKHRCVRDEQTGPENNRKRQHLCHECGKCFYVRGELTTHMVVHRDERPHMCSQCGKSFKREISLQMHMEVHQEKEARTVYPCSYCGKTFLKSRTLVRHNLIHTGERPHRCSKCDKSFLTHNEVVKHMRFHTGERPFKCQICEKAYTQSCYLAKHMRYHTGERPYTCIVCDKRFTESGHLKRHMRIHTGEKPYVCEHCGKAFNQTHPLKVHRQKCLV